MKTKPLSSAGKPQVRVNNNLNMKSHCHYFLKIIYLKEKQYLGG